MTTQNLGGLPYNSPLLRTLFATVATAYSGERSEEDFLAQFVSPMSLYRQGGKYEGVIPDSIIGLAAMQSDKFWLYRDLPQNTETQTGFGPMDEETIQKVRRSSMAVSAGRLVLKANYKLGDEKDMATKWNVSRVANLAHDIGMQIRMVLGDYKKAVMFGYRGVDADLCGTDKHLIDAAGTSFANAATGDFMDKVNLLQKTDDHDDPNAQVVRPLTRIVNMGNEADLVSADGTTAVDYTAVGDYSASNRIGFQNLETAETALSKLSNPTRGRFPFRPAKIRKIVHNGGQTQEFMEDKPVWLVTKDDYLALKRDTEWVSMQESLATRIGAANGMITGKVGELRGICVAAYELPLLGSGTNRRYSLAVAMGMGMMIQAYNARADQDAMGIAQSHIMRRIAGIQTPVIMDVFREKGQRGHDKVIAPRLSAGWVRTNWKNKDGVVEDDSIAAIVTPQPNAS